MQLVNITGSMQVCHQVALNLLAVDCRIGAYGRVLCDNIQSSNCNFVFLTGHETETDCKWATTDYINLHFKVSSREEARSLMSVLYCTF